MEPNTDANLTAQARAELRALQDNLPGELVITEEFQIQDDDGRPLRADLVVLFQERIVAVVTVTAGGRVDLEAVVQTRRLAALLGAPLALIRTRRGWAEVVNAESSLRDDLLPDEADFLEDEVLGFAVADVTSARFLLLRAINLPRRVTTLLRSLAQILNIAPHPPALCQTVKEAVRLWQMGAGATPGTRNAGALTYLHSEFAAACGVQSLPLTQCVLIGAMFEAILQDFTLIQSIPITRPRPTLGTYIGAVQASGRLLGSAPDLLPGLIADNRNRLHPDVYRRDPNISRGLAVNSADVLLWAVQNLGPII